VSLLKLITVVVDDYDPAIAFFVDILGFDLVDDTPSIGGGGDAKRWVVVRPPGVVTGILLAQAEGGPQAAAVGNQTGGRVGFFLQVDDFESTYRRLADAGAIFLGEPRTEDYGRVVVFCDIAGNRWDLLGPVPESPVPRQSPVSPQSPVPPQSPVSPQSPRV
jgi:catechol 2,3-dioxygenase-like lactoylglutathione lyase family enzyme